MATNCGDGVYNIHYTDITKNPITVNRKTLIQDILDITLLGKTRKEYGEVFDENMLHLLENFSCPEDSNNPGNPDLTKVYSNLLQQPTKGQIWYNSTKLRLHVFDGEKWNALSTSSDIGGNSGIIAHGSQLPRPISPVTGYQFTYDECSWIVSPFNFPSEVDYMVCYTDSNAVVTSQYRISDFNTITNGYAFYQIIGIKSNINEGHNNPVVPPIPSPTPSQSPLPGLSVTPTPTPSATPGVTVSPTPTMSPSSTVTPTPSITNTPMASATPTPAASPTPPPTPSVTPSKSIQPLRATLYISPSKGYPQGTNTEIPAICTTNASDDSGCYATMSVIVQELSGGVAPYTVNFGNVFFNASVTSTSGGAAPTAGLNYSYSGASGSATSPIRTGATSTSVLAMNAQIYEASNLLHCRAGSWTMGINGGSYVTITDSQGRVLTLYTPSGINGNVYGTSYTTPQGAYSDSWISSPACSGSGGGCVTVDSIMQDGSLAGDVVEGQELVTYDPYDYFSNGSSKVSYAKTKMQPCVRIVTESGASLVCSTTAPIPTLDNGYMLAPTLINRKVPVMRENITNWETVTTVEFVGEREIRHITVENKCFWAGETADAFILHHNKLAQESPN